MQPTFTPAPEQDTTPVSTPDLDALFPLDESQAHLWVEFENHVNKSLTTH